MAKKALISPQENYRILEVVVTNSIFEVAEPLVWVTCPNGTTTSWTYDHVLDKFDPPVEVVFEVTVVSMRQARLALFEKGHLSSIDTIINSLPEPTRSAARIEWEYATEVQKGSPLVGIMTSSLNLNPTELTELFDLASTK